MKNIVVLPYKTVFRQKSTLITVLLSVCMSSYLLIAQPGSWHPEVDFRPRILLSQADSQRVVNRINSNSTHFFLAERMFETTHSIPADRNAMARTAKNISFFLYIKARPQNGMLINLTAAETDSLKSRVLTILQNFDTSVPSVFEYDKWHHRAREIIMYSQTFDLLSACTFIEDSLWQNGGSRIVDYVANFYQTINDPQYVELFPYNNHRFAWGAALSIAALTFNQYADSLSHRQPLNWVNFGMPQIDRTLWDFQSEALIHSGYSEGSHYFRHVLKFCQPLFRALNYSLGDFTETFSGRNVRNPFYDEKYHLIYDTYTDIRLPFAGLPPVENTYLDEFFPELGLLSNNPEQPNKWAWKNSLSHSELNTLLSNHGQQADYIIAAAPPEISLPEKPPTIFYQDAGFAVFRSSWKNDALYLLATAKNGKARHANSPFPSGHNHADEAAIMLYRGADNLLLHPGYYDFPNTDSLRKGKNHSLILVNEEGPDSAATTFPFENFIYGVDAFIENYFAHPSGDYCEIRTRYQKTDIQRNIFFPRRQYFIINDQLNSNQQNEYKLMLHGNGQFSNGTFLPDFTNQQAGWFIGQSALKMHTVSGNVPITFDYQNMLHAPGYRQWANHDAVSAAVNSDTATFLTTLFPYSQGATAPQLSDFSSPEQAGLQIQYVDTADFFISNRSGNEAQINEFIFRANTAFLSQSPADTIFYFSDGFGIHRQNVDLVQLSDTAAFLLCKEPFRMKGFINFKIDSLQIVKIRVPAAPVSVSGEKVSQWAYISNNVEMLLDSSSAFIIEFNPQTAVEASAPKNMPTNFSITAYPNPFNGSLNINLSIPASADLKIQIFNVLGQRIQLFSADEILGKSVIKWQPQNISGGIYFIHAQNKNQFIVSKILFIP